MAYNGLKSRLDEIFTVCNLRIKELDLDFEEAEGKLLKFKDNKIGHPRKKSKLMEDMEPETISYCLNKTYNIKENVSSKKFFEPAQTYNITPLSTKMHIKNILKSNENSQAQVPVKKFKRKLDVRKLQDESSFFFNKVPALIPLVTTRKPITFDDLDTDDEQAKGQYPKWSFPRYYMRRMKEQIYTNCNLIEAFFSCPYLNTVGVLSIFPSTSPNNLIRNESSIWETEIV